MKIILRITMLIAVVVATGKIAEGSMPPHPRVRQLIAEGKIAEPYYLQHLDELRSRGVNAPWAAPELRLQCSMEAFPSARSLGPALVPQSPFNALVILVDFSDKPAQTDSTFLDTPIFGAGWYDIWLIRLGGESITSVDMPEYRSPIVYSIQQNFSNPFNPSTTIQFELPRSTRISLAIYDVLGNEVTRFNEGHIEGDTI